MLGQIGLATGDRSTLQPQNIIDNCRGDDPTVAKVPVPARQVLSRWDQRSRHYEVRT